MLADNFIKATNEYCTLDSWVPAPYMRKTFKVKSGGGTAEVKISALGFYRVWINGKEFTKGLLAPYISNTNQIVYYDTYDITKHIKKGKNVIAFMLGNGMQNPLGGPIWKEDKRAARSAPALSMELTIKNGEKETVIVSDTSFKVHPSPIIYDDFRTGERYDATEEIEGWNGIQFDDSHWDNAIVAEKPVGELVQCSAEPILKTETIYPIEIEKQDGGYLYKFPKNVAGICKLNVKNASYGQRIEMIYGDMLVDGTLTVHNLTFPSHSHIISMEKACQRTIYMCREGAQTYRPSFTYVGCQYVFISGITDEQATDKLLSIDVYTSALPVVGEFTTTDQRTNGIIDIALASDRSCFYYYPMDCPHREKNGWAGDAVVSADHMLMNFAAETSFRQWMECFRKAQGENGKIPSVVPSFGWAHGRKDGPFWEGIIISIPYDVYTYTQDITVLEENANAIFKYLYYMNSVLENDLYMNGLSDWCRPGYKPPHTGVPKPVVSSIFCVSLCQKAEEIFTLLGKEAEAEYAKTIGAKIRKAVRENLINQDTMAVEGDTQTTQAMALYFGIFNEDEEQKAFNYLLKLIKEKDNLLDVGLVGMSLLFHVLTKYGESELAYNMITDARFPSIGNWYDRGYTTLPEELFDVDEEPRGSLNHHMFSGIDGWFIKSLAGIKFNFDGTVTVKPVVIPQLQGIKASCRGVHVSWTKQDGKAEITITTDNSFDKDKFTLIK